MLSSLSKDGEWAGTHSANGIGETVYTLGLEPSAERLKSSTLLSRIRKVVGSNPTIERELYVAQPGRASGELDRAEQFCYTTLNEQSLSRTSRAES